MGRNKLVKEMAEGVKIRLNLDTPGTEVYRKYV